MSLFFLWFLCFGLFFKRSDFLKTFIYFFDRTGS